MTANAADPPVTAQGLPQPNGAIRFLFHVLALRAEPADI